MVSTTQLAASALTLALASLLAYVGTLCLRRRATGEARLALVAFATWWLGAAAIMLLTNAHTWLALLSVRGGAPHDVLLYLRAPALAAALWGLLYYLAYLLTGRRGLALPLGLFEAGFALFNVYFFVEIGPWVLMETAWEIRYAPTNPAPQGLARVFGALLAGPILVAAAAYGTLLARVREHTPRLRIALVAIAFLGWFGFVLAAFAFGWHRGEAWPLIYQLPGIPATLLVLAAYRPPRWLQRRLGLEPFLQEASE